MSIYTVIFVAFLTVAAVANSGEPRGDRHDGAYTALRYAAAEIRQTEESFAFPDEGRFRKLATRNPALWLIARSGGRSFSFGPVPETAAQLLEQHGDLLESVRFQVPNHEPPLRVAALRRYDFGAEPVILAAGGIDPGSLTVR